MPKTLSPYGSWKSPITAETVVLKALRFEEIGIDDEEIYWIETRPAEEGRSAIVRYSENHVRDVLSQPYSASSRAHEYGGGSFLVHDGKVVFCEFQDQRLYLLEKGNVTPLTAEGNRRFADGDMDVDRRRMLWVMEDHSGPGQPSNSIVSVQLETGEVRPMLEGDDFYSNPRISPDGKRMAWLAWNHPHMPWDESELWMADLTDDGLPLAPRVVAGGDGESVFQPQWSPEGVLHFVSDRSGWWNLYRMEKEVENLMEMEAEFGLPQWMFGLSTYGFLSETQLLCCYNSGGRWKMAILDKELEELTDLPTPYTEVGRLTVSERFAVFVAGSPTLPRCLVRLDLETGVMDVLRRSSEINLDPAAYSIPRDLWFQSAGRRTHAFFYPPHNPLYQAPEGELPPLLVIVHGGPTSATSSALSLTVQFWTSRGFAVADVNYGGSTGFGREYRERLRGEWGIVDVEDCVSAALCLIEKGEVDGSRLLIRGGSAGGYTTLCVLTFKNEFRGGASYFGVCDPIALTKETHNFESHYLEGLIGPFPGREDLYLRRSPLNHAERLHAPTIFFQGLEDKVVPPHQSEMMVDALRRNGTPVAYLAFDGEYHGFRKAENIKRALEAELLFYSRILGFEAADRLPELEIENH
jgi:dipeptidyl aminopeptidase/acylaminoacyl peptidase